MLERDVYSSQDFKNQSKYFVVCKINGEKGQGPALMSQYGISGFPTIKFIKPDGTVVHQLVGYVPLAQFLQEMNTARSAS